MKGILIFVVVFVLLMLSIIVGSQNAQVIEVNYLIAKASMPLSSFMLIMLSIGFVIGLLVVLLKLLSARMKIKLLSRRLRKLSKQA